MSTTTPAYQASVRFSDAALNDAMDVMARVLDVYERKSTEQAAAQYTEPVANYFDEGRFEQEKQHIHRKVPLPLALSCELKEPGSYKAIEVLGQPVVITRDRQGQVHAHLNVCRHRGAKLVPDGTGKTRTLTCPYHAWSYDLSGCLKGVQAEATFGDVERESRSLFRLPAEERAGIVFVSLDRDAELDLSSWLGEMEPLLEAMDLSNCHHYSTRELDGPNWKVTIDGYLESYHFKSLHKNTVYRTNMSNVAAWDSWGPHQRVAFALRTMEEAVGTAKEDWDPSHTVGAIFWLFPGLAIAGGWRSHVAVSLVLPGETAGTSRTQQYILLRDEPESEDEAKKAAETRDWFHDVVLDEDYATTWDVQRGLAATVGETQIFGRNEPALQHFHRTVDAYLGGVPPVIT
jgi:phenylpropionate dioxygenase-like ring-hydroxylating dioxygenase large terminal subunit